MNTKQWTPRMVRERLVEILQETDIPVTGLEIKARMPSAPSPMFYSQLSRVVSKDTVLRLGTCGEYKYLYNRQWDSNRFINSIWRRDPVWPELKAVTR